MQKQLGKFVATCASLSLVATMMAPVAFAEEPVLEISGNGNESKNEIKIENENKVELEQVNVTLAAVGVISVANSGGNVVEKNTGGTSSIDAGKAVSKVDVTVTGGDNTATAPDNCGCLVVPGVLISGNGNKSDNKVKVENEMKTETEQLSLTGALVGVFSASNTGKNTVKKNTGSGSTVTTKKAKSKVNVTVTGGSNTLNP